MLGTQASAADRAAAARLETLDTNLKALKAEQTELTSRWDKEKEDMMRLQVLSR